VILAEQYRKTVLSDAIGGLFFRFRILCDRASIEKTQQISMQLRTDSPGRSERDVHSKIAGIRKTELRFFETMVRHKKTKTK